MAIISNIRLDEDVFTKIAEEYFKSEEKPCLIFVPNNRCLRSLKRALLAMGPKNYFFPDIRALPDEFSFQSGQIVHIVFNIFKERYREVPIDTLLELAESMSDLLKTLFLSNITLELFEKNINENYKIYYLHIYEFIKACFLRPEIKEFFALQKAKYEVFLDGLKGKAVWSIAVSDINYYTHQFFEILKNLDHAKIFIIGAECWETKNYELSKPLITFFNLNIPDNSRNLLKDVSYKEFTSLSDEALGVALCTRKAKAEGKNVSIVCGNEILAGKIKIQLKRWNIFVDDSLGERFGVTQAGLISGAALKALEFDFSLKNTIEFFKFNPIFRDGILKMEKFLRTSKAGVPKKFLKAFKLWREQNQDQLDPKFMEALDFIRNISFNKTHDFYDFQKIHISLINFISESAALEVDAFLKAYRHFEFGYLTLCQYIEFFRKRISGNLVRKCDVYTSGVTLLGITEAQILQSDVIIIASANEASWSVNGTNDFWLSRNLVRNLKIQSNEAKDDFLQVVFERLIAKKEVIITRSQKISGEDVPKYRLIDKYNIVERAYRLVWLEDLNKHLLEIPRKIIALPSPTPVREFRPLRLYVSDVESLVNNPYEFYAKKILRLYELNPIDNFRELKGNFTHALFQTFAKLDKKFDSLVLHEAANALLQALHLTVKDVGFWYFCIENIIQFWLANTSREVQFFPEIHGECQLTYDEDHKLILCCRADRIDIVGNQMVIIDYKTGKPPSKNEISKGQKPQLPLEALIAKEGGFKLKTNDVMRVEFWHITGKKQILIEADNVSKISEVKGIEELTEKARGELLNLTEKYIINLEPYTVNVNTLNEDSPYMHLARLKELQNA